MADETALIVPALHVVPLVERFRLRYSPDAKAGVPPHVTLMYPFLDPARLTAVALRELDRLLSSTPAWEYSLVDLRQFDDGPVYLAPEPAEPFIALTERVGGAFHLSPYGGVHATVVPHLTVAQAATESVRAAINQAVMHSLPQAGVASEAWLMRGSNETRWVKKRAMSFARLGSQ